MLNSHVVSLHYLIYIVLKYLTITQDSPLREFKLSHSQKPWSIFDPTTGALEHGKFLHYLTKLLSKYYRNIVLWLRKLTCITLAFKSKKTNKQPCI